jgi:hypothetical protein
MSAQAPEEVMEKIKKLLKLAGNNPNENEAALAMGKAQQLMEQWNLDAGAVERGAEGPGKRQEEMVEGGFYLYQQELWEEIAKLNFCMYWSQKVLRERGPDGLRRDQQGRISRTKRQHRLLGSKLNVATTVAMSQYLEGAIERITKEEFPGRKLDNYVMSFRQGMAYRLCQKLRQRRMDNLAKEQKAAEEALKRKGVSTATALTLSSLKEQEDAANYDHEYGEGAWAQRKVWRAEAAEEARIRREAHTKWAQENPEAARREEEKRRKADERAARSSSNQRFGKVDDGAFWRGADKAEKVGIDQQMAEKSSVAKIGRAK